MNYVDFIEYFTPFYLGKKIKYQITVHSIMVRNGITDLREILGIFDRYKINNSMGLGFCC